MLNYTEFNLDKSLKECDKMKNTEFVSAVNLFLNYSIEEYEYEYNESGLANENPLNWVVTYDKDNDIISMQKGDIIYKDCISSIIEEMSNY